MKKMEFYRAGATKSLDVALEGNAMKGALEHLRTRSLDKIKGVSAGVKENLRQALILAQSTNQPLVGAASTILGATKLDQGAFSSARKRAVAIAREELRAARQEGLTIDAAKRGVVMFTWISIMSKGSCEDCKRRHGTTHTLAVWKSMGLAPIHFQCACSLIPGRGIPVPKNTQRTQIRALGIRGRIFRQAKESDYLRMKKQFLKCTDTAFGL